MDADVRRWGEPLATVLGFADPLKLTPPPIQADCQLLDSCATQATVQPLHTPITAHYGEDDFDNPGRERPGLGGRGGGD